MSSFIDLTGKKFGLLTVLRDSGKREYGSAVWVCKCDCGNVIEANGAVLRRGDKKSCGCYKGTGNLRHGMSKTRLYRIWTGMLTRCGKNKRSRKKCYIDDDIEVCDEWKRFEPFAKWALNSGYSDELTIERIDNRKGYSPDNCMWADMYVQANNRKCCVYFEKDGKRQTLKQWCVELGLDYKLIHNRINKLGWSFERAISEPIHAEKRNNEARKRK